MAEARAPGKASLGPLTPLGLETGTQLGRYELLAPIGVGGMAKVWAARQSGAHGFAKVVAVKTILPHLAREKDFERLFIDEARVASYVEHPNVCEIYELGEEGHVLFLVMEWVDGDSLFKVLNAAGAVTPIDPRIAALIAAETCAGLHAAHIQADEAQKPLRIVHRDVSPHNILLSSEGVVKVTDFGVAKAAGQTHDQTVAGQLKGKLEYMSPEQITGGAVDARTDVFGMGCVLYEATTGVQPFAANGDLEVMNKIVGGLVESPRARVQGYPVGLEAIVLRALAKDPAKRYASADDMRVALSAWLAESGPPMLHSHVKRLLEERVGSKIAERLARLRAALGTNASARPSFTPHAAGVTTSGVIAKAEAPPKTTASRPPRTVTSPPRPTVKSVPPSVSLAKEDAAKEQKEAAEATLGPDSGFSVDTVADYRLPDFVDPEPGTLRSASSAAPPAPLPLTQLAVFVPPPAQDSNAPLDARPKNAPVVRPASPTTTRDYLLAGLLGVFVAIIVGGGAYLLFGSTSPAPAPASATTPGAR